MEWFYFNIIVFSIIAIPYTYFYYKRYKLTPVTTFLVMEIIMFYGICFFKSNKSVGTSPEAIKLETIYVFAIVFFVLGVETSKRVRLNHKRKIYITQTQNGSFSDCELSFNQKFVVWAIIALSIVLCLYLFIFGGVNVFIRALRDFVGGSLTTYKDERAAYGSVAGAGYIYQFRVVLLPVLATYVTFVAKKRYSKAVTIPLYVFMLICILGTGQRNAFVFYVLIVFLYYLFMNKEYNIQIFRKSQLIFYGVLGFLALALLTIGNGRVGSGENPLIGAFNSIINRVLAVNQGSAITAFRYIDSQETVWGYDWLRMLEQVLPGKSTYIPVDNISYYMDYGTYTGTNPPCLWGSAWYNFGVIGIIVYPFIIGVSFHNIYKTFHKKENKNRFYCLLYIAVCVYLGIWTYGTPMSLFNHGIITIFLLRWIIFTVFSTGQNSKCQGKEIHEI